MLGGVRAAFAQLADIKGHWAQRQITAWADKGLAAGYPDGTFKPDNQITRAEFVTLVNRAFNKQDAGARIDFTDINPSHWFYGEVTVAVAAGYMSGYNDGAFKPNSLITRQEVASVMSRLLQLGEGAAGVSFRDAGSIAAWAAGAVNAVVAAGIMGGYTDGAFMANSPITRAEAVVTVDRALNLSVPETPEAATVIYNQAGTYGPAGGTEAVNAGVIIESAGVTLQNVTIAGDLLLTKGIGEGDVTLNNVTVKGKTTIKGGGANSITLKDCAMPGLTVEKDGVRVVAAGKTTVDVVTLLSGATLVQVTVTGEGFKTVTVSEVVPAGARVILAGDFEAVIVKAEDTRIEIEEGAVKDLTLDARAAVTGKGAIQTAIINASGSSIEQIPTRIVTAKDVTATVGGKTVGGTPAGDGNGDGSASETVLPPRKTTERANLNYADMHPGSLDLSLLEQKLADLSELTRTGGDLTAMVALFKEMDALYNEIYTTRCLLQLRFFINFTKEDYAAFVVAQTAEANALDIIYQAGHMILGAGYHDAFAKWIGDCSIVSSMERHIAANDTVTALRARETELIMEINAANQGDVSGVSVVVDGVKWTVDSLKSAMEADPGYLKYTEAEYASIHDALYEQFCRSVYDTLMELAHVRNSIAAEYGYNNSFDMVWASEWQRDYFYTDFLTVAGQLKRYLAPYYADVTAVTNYLAGKPYTGDVENLLPGFLAMNPSEVIAEPMRYMIGHGLAVYGGEQSYPGGAFSEIMPSYNEVGMYARYTGTLDIFTSLYHELGHAANQYWSQYTGLDINDFQLEIAETQSQALQLLYADWFGRLPGGNTPVEEVVALEVCSRIGAYVMDTAYTTELEHLIYNNHDLDYDTACRQAQELYTAYTGCELPAPNAWVVGFAGLTADHEGYLLAYTISNLCAFELYKEYLTDPGAALAKFDRLLKVDNGSTYGKVATEFGFNHIYEESYYKELAELLEEIMATAAPGVSSK